MTAQPAENRSERIREYLPAEEVDIDVMHSVLIRLVKTATLMVTHVEKGSADMHRDVAPLRAALDAAERLLAPLPLPDAPEDAIVVFARAVKPGDKVWKAADETGEDGVWAEVKGVHPHELHPDVMIQFNVLVNGLPATMGRVFGAPVAILRAAESCSA
jgi:hypothetical protein